MFDIENDRLFWYYTGSSSHGGATNSALAEFRSLTLVHHASMGVYRSVGDGVGDVSRRYFYKHVSITQPDKQM